MLGKFDGWPHEALGVALPEELAHLETALILSLLRTECLRSRLFLLITHIKAYFREIQTAKFAILDKSIPYHVFVGAQCVFCLSLIGALFNERWWFGNTFLRFFFVRAAVL